MRSTVEVPLVNLVAIFYSFKKAVEEPSAKKVVGDVLNALSAEDISHLRVFLESFFDKFLTDEEVEHAIAKVGKTLLFSDEQIQLACLETKIFRNKLGLAKEPVSDQPKSE